jgi:integrase
MDDEDTLFTSPAKREPWNKGKFTGAKPPLRPRHVWSIRSKLQAEGRTRDLAMFNLAIDSKLRACDVVALKVEDVAPNGYAADRATVRQKKTGQPVRFQLTEQTRQAIDDYLRASVKRPGEFMFGGRRGPDRSMTTRQYARLVSEWIASIGLDPHVFGTHSLRRTKATLIYRRTANLRAVQLPWGTEKSRARFVTLVSRWMTPLLLLSRSTSETKGRDRVIGQQLVDS